MTPHDYSIIWQGWHAGRSMSDIGRDVDKAPVLIFGFLRQHGGIEPAIPTRSERTLSLSEREEISRGLVTGMSIRGISKDLGRSPSTVDEAMRVSHETIYKTLYIQSRGLLKRELQTLLRRKRKFRQSRLTNKGCDRGSSIDAVSICERPPEIEDRAMPGHWEV